MGYGLPIALAHFLGRCHSASCTPKGHELFAMHVHTRPPIPTYSAVAPAALARAPGVDYPLYLAAAQGVNEQLCALRSTWAPQCLIHGDVKDDNVMVASETLVSSVSAIKFVDWELAGWGDPLWDVATLVGQFLLYWITALRPRPGEGLMTWIKDATIPFENVQTSIACLLTSYAHFSGEFGSEIGTRLDQLTGYVGVFLMQRAQASLEVTGRLSTLGYCCLTIGKTILARRELAMGVIFAPLSRGDVIL